MIKLCTATYSESNITPIWQYSHKPAGHLSDGMINGGKALNKNAATAAIRVPMVG